MNYYKAKSVIVEKGAKIGRGTKVWHFSHIMKASIGKDCTIGQSVFIGDEAIVGNKVKIQNNCSIYTGVTLEDAVFCGPSVVFTNVNKPRSLYPVNKKYNSTIVKEGATLGANATIICPVTIGKHAFIGAGSVVTKNIPDFALAYGNPCKVKNWVCKCSKKLEFKRSKVYKCSKCNSKYSKKKNKIIQI